MIIAFSLLLIKNFPQKKTALESYLAGPDPGCVAPKAVGAVCGNKSVPILVWLWLLITVGCG